MDIFSWWSVSCILLVGGFYKAAASEQDDQAGETILKRKLRDAGYESLETTTFLLREGNSDGTGDSLNLNHLRRRRRSATPSSQPLQLHVSSHGHQFAFSLNQSQNVLHPDATIHFRSGNLVQEFDGEIPDCFLTGALVSHDSSASATFSYCKQLRGTFYHEEHTYWLESFDNVTGNNLLPGNIQAIVARRPITKRSHTCTADSSEHIIEKDQGRYTAPRRKKRQIPIIPITIEVAVVADALLTANWRSYGATDADLVEMMAFKWTGVAAEYGRSATLYYDMTIAIKAMEFWDTDPAWYQPSLVIEQFLNMFCAGIKNQNMFLDFDHVHLISGVTGTDDGGLGFVGGICNNALKCAASMDTDVTDYFLQAHEMGHNLNMIHDDQYDDCNPAKVGVAGIMGFKYHGFSDCSVKDMDSLLYDFETGDAISCMITDNVAPADVNVDVTLEKKWPGMAFTNDEICGYQHRPGWRFRSYPTSSEYACVANSCIDMVEGSSTYGTMVRHGWQTSGKYCGDGQVCHRLNGCMAYADTGLDPALYSVQAGGWGPWGTMSACSRTCGTGIQYRQRSCDNPKPLNTVRCDGYEYDAVTCNTQPCTGDSDDEATLVQERAAETCTWLVDNSLIESGFAKTGDRWSQDNHGKCEVECDVATSVTTSSSFRFGLMPDGTTCADTGSLNNFEAFYRLSRWPGLERRCVKGYCYALGCDGTGSELVKDACGVCDGDGTTCQAVQGVFSSAVASGGEADAVSVPGLSFLIQAYFTYTDMEDFYLELWSKEGVAIIATQGTGVAAVTDTTQSPVHFAGTYWYYHHQKQFLSAVGPVDQKVTIKLRNTASNSNTGVTYGYSTPLASVLASCTGTCNNGGTWDAATCSCDCDTGWYGVDCTESCSTYCGNGQGHNVDCSCDCQGNTYGTECACRYPFTGQDCQDCKISTCQNGGVFDSGTCRCTCPGGSGGLDCSVTCENTGLDCDADAAAGKCDSDNERMEAECPLACGLCDDTVATVGSTTTQGGTTTTQSSTTTTKTSGTTTTQGGTTTTQRTTTTTQGTTTPDAVGTTTKTTITTTTTTQPTQASVTTTTGTGQTTNTQCASGKFQCSNGNCLSWNLRCNGSNDCGDNSDETTSLCSSSGTTPQPVTGLLLSCLAAVTMGVGFIRAPI